MHKLLIYSLTIASTALLIGTKGAGQDVNTTPPTNTPGNQSRVTRVTRTATQLPNDAGQIWREYDISPYTSQVTTTTRPQQAILDWILRETGSEIWFNRPLGILSADKDRLLVYHTPEVQRTVSDIVDKFVGSKGQLQTLGIKLLTIGKPNWRAVALPGLRPISIQSNGVEGWITSKENAAQIFAKLRQRSDFRLQNAGDVVIHDGQDLTLSQRVPQDYFGTVEPVTANIGGSPTVQMRPVARRINEGYTLEISALTALDQRTLEVVIGCRVDQVEKFQTVRIDSTGADGRRVPIEIAVPQMVSWELSERIRWSSDQVLILSCGVVATPEPDGNGGFDLGKILNQSRGRADALLFIEYKGSTQSAVVPTRPNSNASATPTNNRTATQLVPVAPQPH